MPSMLRAPMGALEAEFVKTVVRGLSSFLRDSRDSGAILIIDELGEHRDPVLVQKLLDHVVKTTIELENLYTVTITHNPMYLREALGYSRSTLGAARYRDGCCTLLRMEFREEMRRDKIIFSRESMECSDLRNLSKYSKKLSNTYRCSKTLLLEVIQNALSIHRYRYSRLSKAC